MMDNQAAKLAPAAPPIAESPAPGELRDYLALARFDHATKHVFILPGLILAYVLRGVDADWQPAALMMGFASAILIASANYVINEWLDRAFDAFHPLKSRRTAVRRRLSPALVYAEYAALAAAGLLLALAVGGLFLPAAAAFLASGLVYNVRPIRSKDRAYLDVLSESINNPIRLVLGWTMVDPVSLPPGSLLLFYWMGGAFLMAAKRLSEFRDLASNGETQMLQRYRRSFRAYTAESLTVSCFIYAMMSAFFIAVFLFKYRVEYILVFPFVGALFSLYLWLSLRPASVAQRPERLFRSRRLMAAVAATVVALLVTSFVEIPGLHRLSEPYFIQLSRD